MKITLKIKKPKETHYFSAYDQAMAFLLSQGENRWFSISFDFNATVTKPFIKNTTVATHPARTKLVSS